MGDASQATVVVSRSPVSYRSPVSWVRGIHVRGRQNVRHSESCSLYHKHNVYLRKSYQVCGVAHFGHLRDIKHFIGGSCRVIFACYGLFAPNFWEVVGTYKWYFGIL